MVRKTVQLKNLEPNENYYVQIRATSSSEAFTTSNWSTKLTFTAGQNAAAPNAPSNLSVVAEGSSFIGTWTGPTVSEDGSALNDFKDYQITVVDLVGGGSEIYYTANESFEFNEKMNRNKFGDFPSGVLGLPNILRKEIQFIVKSRDTANNLSASVSDSATNGAPGPFTLTDDESDAPMTASVSWDTPSGNDILGYRIRRGTSTGVYTEEGVLVGEGANRHIDTFLPRGTYYYIVEAYDKFGNMTPSNEVEVVSKGFWEADFAIPDAPTISNVTTAFDDTSQTATIDFNITGPTTADAGTITDYDYHNRYIIRWSTQVSGPFEYQEIDQRDNTANYAVTIKDLLPDTLYYYGAKSVSEYGQSGVWQTGTITTESDTSPPAAPVGLSATGSLKNITVSWTANSESDLNFYQLFASQTSGAITDTATPRTSGVLPTGYDQKLDPDKSTAYPHAVGDQETWYYRVRAIDLSGNASPLSAEVSATSSGTLGDSTPPGDIALAPTLTANTYYHGASERAYVDVEWDAVVDDLSGYIISYSTDGQVTWFEVTAGPNETTYRIPDLEPGVTVAVRVKAIDGNGNQSPSFSPVATVTPTNTDGAIQQEVSITTGGAIQSDNYNPTTEGFRLDQDSLEIYGGPGTNVSIILGTNGLNLNTTTDQLWFGAASEPSAGFSVNGSGQTRLGDSAGTPIYMNGLSGDMYGGATDFIGTGADWTLSGDGSATFDNVTITGDSAVNNTEVMNIAGQFIVKKVAAGATVDMAGTMNLTGSLNVNAGSINLTGGDLRVTSGDIESSSSWTYGAGVGFRMVNVNSPTDAGVLLAQGAKLRALTVDGNSFLGGTVKVTGTMSSQSAGWQIESTGAASFSNVSITGGTLNIGANFQVTSSGVLNATGVNVTGTINAVSGYLQTLYLYDKLIVDTALTKDVFIGKDVLPADSIIWDGIAIDSNYSINSRFNITNMWAMNHSTGDVYFKTGNNSTYIRYDSTNTTNPIRIEGDVQFVGGSITVGGGNRLYMWQSGTAGYLDFYNSNAHVARLQSSSSGAYLRSIGFGNGIEVEGSGVTIQSLDYSLFLETASFSPMIFSQGSTTMWGMQYSGGDCYLSPANTTSDALVFDVSGSAWRMFVNGQEELTLGNSGFLVQNIGDSSTSLHANVYINSSNRLFKSSYNHSSRRFKEDIVSIDGVGELIDALRPVTFTKRDEITMVDTNESTIERTERAGFIAEEVHEVFPRATDYDDDGLIASYDNRGIVALAVREIQSLRKRVAQLEEKIQE